MAWRVPAEARSAVVQGMPDGGEDAFRMRAASCPEISTGRARATSGRRRRPRDSSQLAAPPAQGHDRPHCRQAGGQPGGMGQPHEPFSAGWGEAATTENTQTAGRGGGKALSPSPPAVKGMGAPQTIAPRVLGGLPGGSAGAHRGVFQGAQRGCRAEEAKAGPSRPPVPPPRGRAGSPQPARAGSAATSQPRAGPGTRPCLRTNKGSAVRGPQLLRGSKQGPCQHIPARSPARALPPAPPTHPPGTPTAWEGWTSPWQQGAVRGSPQHAHPSPACRGTESYSPARKIK